MSRRTELLDRLRRQDDDGFSLVEILVSIVIAGVVAAAVLPLLLSGILAGNVAKADTQAKGLAQQRLEQMRNMPFYVQKSTGDYLDVLDVYFRNTAAVAPRPTSAPPTDICKERGYVSATLTYTCLLDTRVIGVTRFDQRIDTTFINAAGTVLPPRTGYNSQPPAGSAQQDTPSSNLLAVTVTTSWKAGGKDKSFVLRSRIAKTNTDAPLITSSFKGSAVRLTSTSATSTSIITGTDTMQFEAGLISGEGTKSTASSAKATAVGAYASVASGAQAQGAGVTLSAPADAVVPSGPSKTSQDLDLDLLQCRRICFGPTAISGSIAATVSTGVPVVGDPASGGRLRSVLSRTGNPGERGFSFSNSTLDEAFGSLGVTELPLVRIPSGSGGPVVETEGALNAVSSGATNVSSTVRTKAQTLKLFRTAYATDGLVHITLSKAELTCTDAKAGATTVVPDWDVTVAVFDGSGYSSRSYRLRNSGGDALPSPTELLSIPAGPGRTLGSYISSWSAMDPAQVNKSAAAAKGDIPAVLTILTQPTRTGDPTSAVNIAVASLSCIAEDNQ